MSMDDRLVWLLKYFNLHARVFQAGPLCRTTAFDAGEGLGHIHVLEQGALKVETAGAPATRVAEPCLLFYMNPTTHRLTPLDEQVEMVCASFEFGTGLLNPLAQAFPEMLLLKLADAPALADALSLLFREEREKHCGRQAVLDRLMEIVIIHLLRDLMDQHRLELGVLAGLADPKLARVLNAVHADPARAWNLYELAETAGMSRARFAEKFHKTVGTTPGNYLATWRIGIAQSMLRTGKSVQYTADAVGYANASALSRAFTSHAGMTPKEWRKLNMDKA